MANPNLTIELDSLEKMESPMQEVINKISKDLIAKKEAIIRQKFEEKGFSHLLNDMDKQRFKRVHVEQWDDCEKWYADDGTDNGVLIVTFENIGNDLVNLDNSMTLKTTIQYY